MQKLLDEMTPLLKVAGISKKDIDILIYQVKELEGKDEGKGVNDFVSELYNSHYKELHRVYNLAGDPSLWLRYKAFGITGLPEQLLLEKASKAVRKAWKSFYNKSLIKREGNGQFKKADIVENSNSESVEGVSV